MTIHWSAFTASQKANAVREGMAAGLTHAQIAANYEGCTRSASIGIARRARLERPAGKLVARSPARPPKPPKCGVVKKPPAVAAPVFEVQSLGVRFVDRAGRCAYIDGGRDAAGFATCCGHEVVAGSWCGWHQRLVYRVAE